METCLYAEYASQWLKAWDQNYVPLFTKRVACWLKQREYQRWDKCSRNLPFFFLLFPLNLLFLTSPHSISSSLSLTSPQDNWKKILMTTIFFHILCLYLWESSKSMLFFLLFLFFLSLKTDQTIKCNRKIEVTAGRQVNRAMKRSNFW